LLFLVHCDRPFVGPVYEVILALVKNVCNRSKAPFRVRIRRAHYCSHRNRIAALRQHTVRLAKSRKLTKRARSGDDTANLAAVVPVITKQ
jgi:hypothetical protein